MMWSRSLLLKGNWPKKFLSKTLVKVFHRHQRVVVIRLHLKVVEARLPRRKVAEEEFPAYERLEEEVGQVVAEASVAVA